MRPSSTSSSTAHGTAATLAEPAPVATGPFTVNGRTYEPPPCPVVVICMDGCSDEYLNASLSHGRMPHLDHLIRNGFRGVARAALPTFTNVNNAAIIAGAPPAVTGISGNFFLDPTSGERVMMNDASYLRCPTIVAAAARAGRRVAIVTAKEKLRDILGKDLQGIAFSAEKADQTTDAKHGITDVLRLVGRPLPAIYSADASLFVLWAGVALIESRRADFLYLSLTDYMQHKYAPEAPESLDFYAQMDQAIGRLIELGARVAATADHGMNAKNTADHKPNVIYVQTHLEQIFGPGPEVICPITDPYVLHHGALGSLVMVHLRPGIPAAEVARALLKLDGVTEVYDRETAARKLELPADRIGDLTVLASRDVVLGARPADHDLSLLKTGLRSHGGRYEEMVPLLLSEPLSPAYRQIAERDPRNFDVFDFACNGVTV
ncbi:MAG TPA: phosphonoacetate hydrolase [Planctomycetota bacterium]|nr:phosphonoacetate hydrolase [Planctomycetota bacterium]